MYKSKQEKKPFINLLKSKTLLNELKTNKYSIEAWNKGKSESYVIKNSNGNILTIFKPNTNRYANMASEYAAYIISKVFRLNVVPAVKIVTLPFIENGKKIDKLGSLQWWFKDYQTARDIKKTEYSKFNELDVKKILFLDYLIGNTDRHAGNILVKLKPDGKYAIRAIDHGLSMVSKKGKISTLFNSFNFQGLIEKDIIDPVFNYLSNFKSHFIFTDFYTKKAHGFISKDKIYGVIQKIVLDAESTKDEYLYSTIRYNYNTLIPMKDILYSVIFSNLQTVNCLNYYIADLKELNALWLLKKLVALKHSPTWETVIKNMVK